MHAKGTCPIFKVAQLLSDPWTMMIIHYLNEGPKRFSDLMKILEGISSRTLTLKLAKLVELNIVSKNKEGIYATTKEGKGLKKIVGEMRKYQDSYL